MGRYLRSDPVAVFSVGYWWLRGGKARVKAEIASRVDIDAGSFAPNAEFVAFLREERAAGRRLVLATASNERYAKAFAARFGVFEAVLASRPGDTNSGRHKLQRIRDYSGGAAFDYAGNDRVDMVIFDASEAALVVAPTRRLRRRLSRLRVPWREFDSVR